MASAFFLAIASSARENSAAENNSGNNPIIIEALLVKKVLWFKNDFQAVAVQTKLIDQCSDMFYFLFWYVLFV